MPLGGCKSRRFHHDFTGWHVPIAARFAGSESAMGATPIQSTNFTAGRSGIHQGSYPRGGGSTPRLLPFSNTSGRSVAANALGLGPRDRECESPRPDHHFQACGPVRGAPPCEGGEIGCKSRLPDHFLGNGDEGVESRPCHGRVSGCESRRSRHFSRRRQAAKAPGLHPGIPGVRVPPSRPLFHSGVADKQGTELLTRPMKERYLPPEPLSFGT